MTDVPQTDFPSMLWALTQKLMLAIFSMFIIYRCHVKNKVKCILG